jgi:hypothetical protein
MSSTCRASAQDEHQVVAVEAHVGVVALLLEQPHHQLRQVDVGLLHGVALPVDHRQVRAIGVVGDVGRA